MSSIGLVNSKSARLFFLLTSLLISSDSLPAQIHFSGSSLDSPSRMKVLDRSSQEVRTYYFTIVGAVNLPGVFHAVGTDQISLKELITVARGFSPDASQNVRFIRQGSSMVRSFSSTENGLNEIVTAGDIVVVVPNTTANIGIQVTTPVAVVGLTERPVVLPLSSDILSIEDLTTRLRQPLSLVDHAVVMDPYGRRASQILISGSVILFDPQFVNRAALEHTQAFPPSLPIKQQQPAAVSNPNLPPAVSYVEKPPGDLQVPEMLPTPTIQANGVVEAVYSEPVNSLLPAKTNPFDQELQSHARLPATSGQPSHIVQTSQQSRAPIAADFIPQIPREIDADSEQSEIAFSPILAETDQVIAETQQAAPWTVIILVAMLTATCLLGAIAWSRYENRRELLNKILTSDHSSTRQKPRVGNPAIQEILDREIPLIEEEVISPQDIPLYGTATTDDIYAPADEVLGDVDDQPVQHYDTVEPETKQWISEERFTVLDQFDLKVVEKRDRTQIHLAATSDDSQHYDVVLPEPEAAVGRLSPLDRALRSLAGEDAA